MVDKEQLGIVGRTSGRWRDGVTYETGSQGTIPPFPGTAIETGFTGQPCLVVQRRQMLIHERSAEEMDLLSPPFW